MTTYYTFKKNVRLKAGQFIDFLTGKGYFAAGTPTPTPQPITMYDSVTVSQIPATAAAVAGYVGGRWPTYVTLLKQFPHAHVLSIAVIAAQDADALDIEYGDATPDQAPAWFVRQLKRGVKQPVLYVQLSNAQALVNEMTKAGIKRTAYRLWTAHYTYTAHRCNSKCGYNFTGTADATQYSDHALGRNLDASLCSPTFFASDV